MEDQAVRKQWVPSTRAELVGVELAEVVRVNPAAEVMGVNPAAEVVGVTPAAEMILQTAKVVGVPLLATGLVPPRCGLVYRIYEL